MSQISQIEVQIATALDRLRVAMVRSGTSNEARDGGGGDARLAQLEADKAGLLEELDSLRSKRDKDVAALDDLIAQLKPLIEEV